MHREGANAENSSEAALKVGPESATPTEIVKAARVLPLQRQSVALLRGTQVVPRNDCALR